MHNRIPTERSFGLSVGGVCLAIAAFSWWRGSDVLPAVFGAVGVALVGAGLVVPAALHIPNRVWWRFAQALGWFNARVLLTAFFALVLTPIGLAMRLFGRNVLRPSQPGTNWLPHPGPAA